MTTTFIPGYEATVTLNAQDLTVVGQVISLQRERAVLDKPTFGSGDMQNISGIKSLAFSANGHLAAEIVAALDAIFESDVAVAFAVQIGVAAGATDGGIYAGFVVLGTLTIEADATDEWNWSIEASSTGPVTYTPPTP